VPRGAAANDALRDPQIRVRWRSIAPAPHGFRASLSQWTAAHAVACALWHRNEGLSVVAKQRNRGKPTRRRDKKGGPGSGRRKPCPYCKEKIEQADYKDTATLRKFISEKGKIRSRRITGACRRHQSQIARAVKRARELALLPYVNEGGRDDAERETGGRGRRGRDER
jgi:small subunit ribosomal protein S18